MRQLRRSFGPEAKQHNTVNLDRALDPDRHGKQTMDAGGVRVRKWIGQGDTTRATHTLAHFVVEKSALPEGTRRSWRFTHRHDGTSTSLSGHRHGGSHSQRARVPRRSAVLRPTARIAQPTQVPNKDLVPRRAELPRHSPATAARDGSGVPACGRLRESSPRRMKEKVS
jgi:hypothetical protein